MKTAIKILITILLTSTIWSCVNTKETIRTEYKVDSTYTGYLKEQILHKDNKIADLSKELKEYSRELVKLQSETNTLIEKYDKANDTIYLTERITINNKESSTKESVQYTELLETISSRLEMLSIYNQELKENVDLLKTQTHNSKQESKPAVNSFWKILSLILFILAIIEAIAIYLLTLKK